MNLPNILTLSRIFLVPLLVAALVQEQVAIRVGAFLITNDLLALAIFLVAAATDLLDGYLARRWGQVTTIGTLLDPIADKLLVSAALISLVQVRAIEAWMTILIVGREFAVSGLRSIAAAEGYTIKAGDLGKTKMLSQVAAIAVLLAGLRRPQLAAPARGLLWIVVVFSVVSAIDYFRKFWGKVDMRIKRRRRRELLVLERVRKQELWRETRAARSARQRGSAAGADFRGVV